MFTVAIIQWATIKPPNIIAHIKGFKCHAATPNWRIFLFYGFIRTQKITNNVSRHWFISQIHITDSYHSNEFLRIRLGQVTGAFCWPHLKSFVLHIELQYQGTRWGVPYVMLIAQYILGAVILARASLQIMVVLNKGLTVDVMCSC